MHRGQSENENETEPDFLLQGILMFCPITFIFDRENENRGEKPLMNPNKSHHFLVYSRLFIQCSPLSEYTINRSADGQ